MDAWIDTYHAVRGLTRDGTFVFLTDSAVGTKEEDNLRHLVNNMGADVPRSAVVPFLTCKHPLDYCLAYADRAAQHGFRALVVLGGDKSIGPPRCVAHAWELRERIRQHRPDLALGGWANPHGGAADQVGHLLEGRVTAEFYLTQIVSHHSRARSLPGGGRPPRPRPAGHGRHLLRSVGEPEDAGVAESLPAGPGGGARAGVRRRRLA
jgi:hypothetical protein